MKRKQPMTLAQHATLGAQLKLLRGGLPVVLPYPKGSVVQQRLRKLIQAIDNLRCALDDQAARDLGREFDVRLYYGRERFDVDSAADCEPEAQFEAERQAIAGDDDWIPF